MIDARYSGLRLVMTLAGSERVCPDGASFISWHNFPERCGTPAERGANGGKRRFMLSGVGAARVGGARGEARGGAYGMGGFDLQFWVARHEDVAGSLRGVRGTNTSI